MITKETRLRALQHQIKRLEQRLERWHQTSYRYAWLRTTIFFTGLLLSGLTFYFVGGWLFWISFTVSGLLFGLSIYYHRQIDNNIIRHNTWRQIKLAQIARMQLDWLQIPTVWHHPRYDHPFEADLDLAGEQSLHRLLDTTISYEGSQLLRTWLTTPVPELQQIRRRQDLVRELIPLSLFRAKLILNATLTTQVKKVWDAKRLVHWLERRTPDTSLRLWLGSFTIFAAFNLLLFGLNRIELIPPIWQVSLILYFGLLWARSKVTGAVFHEALALQDALQQLRAVFQQLETFSYRNTPHLKILCAPFLDRTNRPSQHLKRIARIVAATGIRGNPFIWIVLNAVFPWDFYFAYRLNRVKTDLVRHVPVWLEVWFELEALSALANLAYLNPGYTLPTVLIDNPANQAMVFQARGLGHPLIPDAEKVCNDFTIRDLGEIAIITGSNMAGKSTFLRTVGLNLILAYAGGPVNAHYLQTYLFRVFTCIKVTDSVTNGISYFYAEVKRLKALLSALEDEHPLPLFFYIDEIFRGTNNRERFIGSRAYIQTLVSKHGVGLISTHDLELAKLAEETLKIKNYHFRDEVSADRMVFDYTLHPGPCPTTNALKIMQMEGLPVPPR